MKKIKLTQGKYALVDDADFEYLNQWKWYCANGYAVRSVHEGKSVRQVQMHRLLLSPQDGKEVDHVNRDRADNRRENLRVCTRQQNSWNSNSHNKTGYKGVRSHKPIYANKEYFVATIKENGKAKYLGTFKTPEKAHSAYVEASKRLHGDFSLYGQQLLDNAGVGDL